MKGKQITIGENKKQRVFYNNLSTYLELINNYLSKKIKTGKLGKHIKILGGYAFKSSQYQKEGIPVIRISDFQNEKIDLSGVKCYEEKPEYDKYQLFEGDILIAMTGGTIGKLGIVQAGLGKLYLNQRVGKFHILKPEEFFDRYVYWLARGVQERVKSFGYGGAQPNISGKQIEELDFPIPDKKTQKKIVNFLESLKDNFLENQEYFDSKTEKKILKLQDMGENLFQVLENSNKDKTLLIKLKQAILTEAVRGKLVKQNPEDESAVELLKKIKKEKEKLIKDGKIRKGKELPAISDDEIPYELPRGWEWCRLGDIIKISSGNGLTSKEMNKNGGIPVYGGNGVTGYHDKFNISRQTIVIGRVGFYCGSIHLTPGKAWITDNAFITKFSEWNINRNFLRILLTGTNLKEEENATAQPVISGRKVYPIIIGLPPLSEQKRIVKKVDALMKLCDELELKIKKNKKGSEKLMGAVLGEVFGG